MNGIYQNVFNNTLEWWKTSTDKMEYLTGDTDWYAEAAKISILFNVRDPEQCVFVVVHKNYNTWMRK